jgi:hypothetical protein
MEVKNSMQKIPFKKLKIGMKIISISHKPVIGFVIDLGTCRNTKKDIPLISLKTINGGYACITGREVLLYQTLFEMVSKKSRKSRRKKSKMKFIRGGRKK